MTRRNSVRAQAQEIYCERAEDTCVRGSLQIGTPVPIPPPHGGSEESVPGGGNPPSPRVGGQGTPSSEGEQDAAHEDNDLTAQVRALYEGSGVPVREIAALAGVTERTVYKYARK